MTEEQIKLLKIMKNKKRIDYVLFSSLINYGLSIWGRIFRRNFYNSPLEFNDGMIVIYNAYNKVANNFINYELDDTLFLVSYGNTVRSLSLNYLKRFSRKKHSILNNSEDISEIKNIDKYISDTNDNYCSEINEEKIEYIYKLCNSTIKKSIINLKLKGFNNKEICNELNINSKQLENQFYNIKVRHFKNNQSNNKKSFNF